jgi:hypothetical protein
MARQSPWHNQQEAFGKTLEALDKWLHLAVYFGMIAQELGADKSEINRLICCTDKAEIDRLLLEKMRNIAEKGKK